MARAAFLTLVFFLPLLAGCGTFADALCGPLDDHLYYRGVRLDVMAIKGGTPIMALDLPFSACADTLLVPSIAIGQLADPPVTKHKSVLQGVGEGVAKSVIADVMVPVTVEMMKTADTEVWKQQPGTSVVPGGLAVQQTEDAK